MDVECSHERSNIRKDCLGVLVVYYLLLSHKEFREEEILVQVLLVSLLSQGADGQTFDSVQKRHEVFANNFLKCSFGTQIEKTWFFEL